MPAPARKERPRLTAASLKAAKPESSPYELRSDKVPGLVARCEPSGTMNYWVLVSRGKRIKLGSTRVLTMAQAEDTARRVLVDPEAYAKSKHKSATLEEFIEDHYEPWAKAHRKTADATVARLKASFEKKFYRLRLDDVTLPSLERWRTDRINGGTAKATVNRDLVALSAVLTKAVEWGALEVNPLHKLKPLKVTSKKVRFLSAEEEARLRAALIARDADLRERRESGNAWRTARDLPLMPEKGIYGDHLTPMVLLSINAGLRQGEVFNLTWDDVDLGRKLLTVRADIAKSGKLRHVNLNSEAARVLTEWQSATKAKAGLVFPGKKGNPFTDVKKAWATLLSDAKIADFRWHDMRHHFASRFVMTGGDLNTLRELLGHADIKMVLRYAHLSSEHKAAAIERISGGVPA